jgi:hypothetical protein
MPDALQQTLVYAFPADNAVTEKVPSWTEQAKIVKCLDNGNVPRRTRRLDRGRFRHERVMNMNQIGTLGIQDGRKFATRPRGPDHFTRACNPVQ